MFKEINLTELPVNPFVTVEGENMLISAGNRRGFNAMSASWGTLGRVWNKPAVTVYPRPHNNTSLLMNKNGLFALSFFSREYARALAQGSSQELPPKCCCSPLSFALGLLMRNKEQETGALSPYFTADTVSFRQASLILICKTLYSAPMSAAGFAGGVCPEAGYSEGPLPSIYIGEILKALAACNAQAATH